MHAGSYLPVKCLSCWRIPGYICLIIVFFWVLIEFLPIIYFKEIQFGTTPSGAAAAWQHPPRFADAAAQCGPQLGIGIPVVAKSFYLNREFRSLNCSAVLIFRNPRKAMFGPESASWGVTGSYSWVYYIWVWGFTKFAKFFYSNREFRSLNCWAVLIFRNPRKAMFAPEGGLRDRTVEYTTWVWGFT